jgi:hypothetical protein
VKLTPPSDAEVKNGGAIPPLPHTPLLLAAIAIFCVTYFFGDIYDFKATQWCCCKPATYI